ncbi:hypothetical protein [Streptomyces sp. UNOB3_S3]|uniref:hypothetical protein n=1 Tax=Streptomyces sp. UNOB3_S3 TaxID=2871682 RepID=UPI001E5E9C24|nr:hypothetical protein [Streptomyces sp. UNOB3_S3]MCC3775738.1 hypothetical protein [Streptomyces sp. UNOB3_S3]
MTADVDHDDRTTRGGGTQSPLVGRGEEVRQSGQPPGPGEGLVPLLAQPVPAVHVRFLTRTGRCLPQGVQFASHGLQPGGSGPHGGEVVAAVQGVRVQDAAPLFQDPQRRDGVARVQGARRRVRAEPEVRGEPFLLVAGVQMGRGDLGEPRHRLPVALGRLPPVAGLGGPLSPQPVGLQLLDWGAELRPGGLAGAVDRGPQGGGVS